MTYTITKEQYNAVNNGRIDLLHAIEKLKGVVHPDLLDHLEQAQKQMREGLEPVFRQMQAEDEKWEEHVEFVEKLYGPFPNSIWSVREVEDLQADTPYTEARTLVYANHWGDRAVGVPITGNKWVDVWHAAEQAIVQSGDQHHVFIEAVNPDPNNPSVLRLETGS
jgi:hypothetical protein